MRNHQFEPVQFFNLLNNNHLQVLYGESNPKIVCRMAFFNIFKVKIRKSNPKLSGQITKSNPKFYLVVKINEIS